MKNFKIAFVCIVLVMTAFASLLIFSCQKENLESPIVEPALFTKEITITDRSGKNSAVIQLSSTDESALTVMDYSKVIKIEPIFEVPEVDKVEGQATYEDVPKDNSGGINLEIVSRQLEEGAIGLKLNLNEEVEYSIQDRSVMPVPTTLITPYNNFLIVAIEGCHQVEYSRRPTSSGDWIEIGNTPKRCPQELSIIGPILSYRLRAKITKSEGYSTVTADVYMW